MRDLPAFFLHDKGICESASVGDGTRIWAYAHVLSGARIGRGCNICDHVFIENDVVVGDDVTIKCGVQLWDGLRIGNGVFIGPNATFANDRFPRSKQYPGAFLQTIVEDGASIGANATILPGLRIGRSAMVGAGAVVTRDVPANSVVVGNPATVVRYQAPRIDVRADAKDSDDTGVRGAVLWPLKLYADPRGCLMPIELETGLPFVARRSFLVFGVPAGRTRGAHAHRSCEQFLLVSNGQINVLIDDGHSRCEVVLNDPSKGLHLPPLIWGEQFAFSENAVLTVFASHPYDAADYINDYGEFLQLTGKASAAS